VAAPLFKWPGGKRWLAPLISNLYWHRERKLIEPFAGGAAVFFALEPSNAILGDMNPEVINCYRWVRDDVESLVRRLSEMKNSSDDYYRIRAWIPTSAFDRAVRFLYLTRLSFNGIYRENRQGVFNVPYGGKSHLDVVQRDALFRSSEILQGADLISGDFEVTAQHASPGDLVYFDPPYTSAHNSNGFVKYNARIFSWSDQKRLAKVASELLDKGCLVIASNADHVSITELYPEFEVHQLSRFSVIGSKSHYRKEITESLFVGQR
jgi:DNA adenine methylase